MIRHDVDDAGSKARTPIAAWRAHLPHSINRRRRRSVLPRSLGLQRTREVLLAEIPRQALRNPALIATVVLRPPPVAAVPATTPTSGKGRSVVWDTLAVVFSLRCAGIGDGVFRFLYCPPSSQPIVPFTADQPAASPKGRASHGFATAGKATAPWEYHEDAAPPTLRCHGAPEVLLRRKGGDMRDIERPAAWICTAFAIVIILAITSWTMWAPGSSVAPPVHAVRR